MYTDEWKPVMTADSIEERIQKFAVLAQKRAEEQDKSIEDVVYKLTHDSYLMKHTTGDMLKELRELQDLHSDAFYNGEANDHIMEYLESSPNFDFWYDHVYLVLAAGLERAVLKQIKESVADAGSLP